MNQNIPPQAIDLEQAVLGALMLETPLIVAHVSELKAEYFYKDSHQLIAETIIDLYSNGEPVDLLTVTNHLRSKKQIERAGGAFYLTELTSSIASGANVGVYLKVIQEKYLLRKMINLGSELVKRGMDESQDCFDLMDFGQMSLIDLVGNMISKSTVTLKQSLTNVFEEMAHNIQKRLNNEITGVATGIHTLDDFTGGWQKGDLVIIAARPAMGKTGLALSMARAAAKEGKKILMCSLEMTHTKLSYRLIAQETKMMEITRMQRGEMDQHDLNVLMQRTNHLTKYNLHLDDDANLSVMQLRAKANQMKQKHGLDMIVVDYLQLMHDDKKETNREQEISRISRGLKVLAKDLDIPVIALSQLSRAVETRGGDHKPKLSDLRESGSIEQDADMVIFLYRPEYYGIQEYQISDNEVQPTKGLSIGIISKHRNGAVGEFMMKFNHKYTDFTDWNQTYSHEGVDFTKVPDKKF